MDKEPAHSTHVAEAEQRSSELCSPAQAFWNQREWLREQRDLILKLSTAIGCASNLATYQWAQVGAFTAEFHPDLVLELGRGYGNSTACFTQTANHLGGKRKCKVLSLCMSDLWERFSLPKLEKIVPAEWFEPIDARRCNILTCDIVRELNEAKRIMVFWDAHGFEVAEWVLGWLLPKIASKPHVVMMHDVSDARYVEVAQEYGEGGLWKGVNASHRAIMIGHIFSHVGQAISLLDFSSRNQLPLNSADESFHLEFAADREKRATLTRTLGDELFQMQSHWFWFTLVGARQPITFPKFMAPVGAGAMLGRDYSELRLELEAIHNSAGWKILTSWRRLRDAVVPNGSRLRNAYDSLKTSVFGGRR